MIKKTLEQFRLGKSLFLKKEYKLMLILRKTNKFNGLFLRDRRVVNNKDSKISSTFFDSKIEIVIKNILDDLDLYGHVMYKQ